MNTILITGTAKSEGNKVSYNVNIWASKEGEQIQLITWQSMLLDGYNTLWSYAKGKVCGYFGNDHKFDDGAYTTFLDQLIMIK
jgi:hypothetical protein